jgi:hypothetical protein
MRVERMQLRLGPLARARGPVDGDRAQLLVAVAEDVARDLYDIARGALGRIPAGVDDGLGVLDVDAWRRRRALRGRHLGQQYPIGLASNVGS